MPRKGHIAKPEVLPDPIYNSKLVTSMINHLMLDGKRGTASKILYQAFNEIKDQTGDDPVEVFEQAIENVQPALEVKARRIGGSNYQVPIEVRPDRQRTLALRWLTQFARLRGEHTMVQRLAAEIIDASNNTGASIKKKEDTLRMAEANRAFAHYRW